LFSEVILGDNSAMKSLPRSRREFLLRTSAAALALPFVSFSAETDRLKVLVVTGGHGFNREPFFAMFKANEEIVFAEAKHSYYADAYERPDLYDFDVVVLYDMPKAITAAQKERALHLFKKGRGLVVLHHAIVSYQHWDEYEKIMGGRYPEEDGKSGVVTDLVGYQHDVDLNVKVVAKDHPITQGLNDFTIHDEIYWGYRVSKDVTPLISTDHPKSAKPLGWVRQEGKSRIVYIQLGHGPEAHQNPNYQKLLRQSIRWAAGK
jgi:type 1 glutamine amidotransferase